MRSFRPLQAPESVLVHPARRRAPQVVRQFVAQPGFARAPPSHLKADRRLRGNSVAAFKNSDSDPQTRRAASPLLSPSHPEADTVLAQGFAMVDLIEHVHFGLDNQK